MEMRRIEGLDKKISPIFFGAAGAEFLRGDDCAALLDGVVRAGVNAIDTARQYGLSEKALGDWMEARGNREDLVILSKCAHPDPDGRMRVNEKEMREDLLTSLRLLKTDHIDIYLLHRDDPSVPAGTVVEILNEMKARGQIRLFGGSNWTARRIEEANEYAYRRGLSPFSVSSPHFGLAEQVADLWGYGGVSLTGAAQEEERAWYRKTGMPIVAYSSLARGLFTGRIRPEDEPRAKELLDSFGYKGYYSHENFERLRRAFVLAERKGTDVSSVALSWMYRQGTTVFALTTTTKPERMRANLAAPDLPLSPAECAWLNLQTDEEPMG